MTSDSVELETIRSSEADAKLVERLMRHINAARGRAAPCISDSLAFNDDAKEWQLKQILIDEIQKWLLELGTGFALCGREYALIIGDQEFFLDLIFYHHKLRRFVVIEIKLGEFEAEFIGQMNLHLNAVDEQLRTDGDKESVGIILCASRNEAVVKMALHRVRAPIAVSTWQPDMPARELPPVEISEKIPTDPGELAELEIVRERLIENVARRTPEIVDSLEKQGD